jgi:hypothetical protein
MKEETLKAKLAKTMEKKEGKSSGSLKVTFGKKSGKGKNTSISKSCTTYIRKRFTCRGNGGYVEITRHISYGMKGHEGLHHRGEED